MPKMPEVAADELRAFLTESLRIEGIMGPATGREVDATKRFLRLENVELVDMLVLVDVYQPNAVLRDRPGINVRVGNHIAPPGGPLVKKELVGLLLDLATADPWRTHMDYETLHPFTDGNGRSGRALWAWQMVRRQQGLPLGFLHQWYYQTLERSAP